MLNIFAWDITRCFQHGTANMLVGVSAYTFVFLKGSGYFSRTRLKCSFTVVKTPLYCTRKWSCNLSCTSALSLLQLPCNSSTGQFPLLEHETFWRNTWYMYHVFLQKVSCSGRGTWPVEPLHGSCSRLNADVQLKLQLQFLVQYNGVFTTVQLHLSRVHEK